jgi:hypothetical protein
MSRRLLVVTAAAPTSLAWTGSASAALYLLFSTTRAPPGSLVTVRTAGEGALPDIPSGSPPLRVFLAPVDAAEQIQSPEDERLVLLGRLRVDREGNGNLQFRVPDVAPGEYVTLAHCVPCAPFSVGRELVPTGPFPSPFVVMAAADEAADEQDSTVDIPIAALALATTVALLVDVGLGWFLQGRRPR